MQAVRWEHGEIRVRDVPSPRGEGVSVKIESAGICGSDVHVVNAPDSPIYSNDITLGHELAGVTSNGVPVVIDPMAGCGQCDLCQSGDYNLCRKGPDVFGVTKDGGMTEQLLVPERALIRLPAGLEPRNACLVEPIGVALHGLRRAKLEAGKKVAIVGGGPVGLCAAAVAVHAGCSVVVSARHPHQNEVAEKIGASLSGSNDDYDIVVDAAGTNSALTRCIELAKPGGKVALLAVYWDGFDFDMAAASLKELTVYSSMAYGHHGPVRDLDMAANVLGMRPELSELIITHRFPLNAAKEAFVTAAARDRGAIKVVMDPQC